MNSRWIWFTWLLIVILFLYSPIVALVAFSFKSGSGISFPYEGVSLDWYATFFRDSALIGALFRSLELALATTAVTTVLCVLTGLALRKKFVLRDLTFYVIMFGMLIPGVVYGVGSALFYRTLNVDFSLWTALPIHVVWTLPFGIIIMLSGFDENLASYEAASRTLGCSGWRVFTEITLPLISPQVMSAALFAFTLSFGELLRTIFVVGTYPTLPVLIYAVVANKPATPMYFALGTTITVISIALVLLAGFFMTRRERTLF